MRREGQGIYIINPFKALTEVHLEPGGPKQTLDRDLVLRGGLPTHCHSARPGGVPGQQLPLWRAKEAAGSHGILRDRAENLGVRARRIHTLIAANHGLGS